MRRAVLVVGLLAGLMGGAGAVPQNDKLEGIWSYGRAVRLLKSNGFRSVKGDCRPTRSNVAQHCTEDFRNRSGVQLSIAVRSTFDSDPDVVYRIVCTDGCWAFTWSDLD